MKPEDVKPMSIGFVCCEHGELHTEGKMLTHANRLREAPRYLQIYKGTILTVKKRSAFDTSVNDKLNYMWPLYWPASNVRDVATVLFEPQGIIATIDCGLIGATPKEAFENSLNAYTFAFQSRLDGLKCELEQCEKAISDLASIQYKESMNR